MPSGHRKPWHTPSPTVASGAASKGLLVRKVSKHVALSPVARAVAVVRLNKEVVNLLIHAYNWETGEERPSEVTAMSLVLSIVMTVLEKREDKDHRAYRVMQGALSALVSMSSNGFRWRASDAVAVHTGVQRAVEISKALPAREVQAAWAALET